MKIVISIVILLVLIALCSTPGIAEEGKTPLSLKDDLIKIVATSLASSLLTYLFAAKLKSKELSKTFDNKIQEINEQFKYRIQEIKNQMQLQQEAERKTQEASLRLQYVNPMRRVTGDLTEKISDIEGRLNTQYEPEMKSWFRKIKDFCDHKTNALSKKEFTSWCYYEGLFAMTTLHQVAEYFAYAHQILQKSPFSEINRTYAEGLADQLRQVKEAFGGNDGIYSVNQDAVGNYVVKDDRIMNYIEFCRNIVNASDDLNTPVFLRTIDFFHRDDLLTKKKLSQVRIALDHLQQFLASVPASCG